MDLISVQRMKSVVVICPRKCVNLHVLAATKKRYSSHRGQPSQTCPYLRWASRSTPTFAFLITLLSRVATMSGQSSHSGISCLDMRSFSRVSSVPIVLLKTDHHIELSDGADERLGWRLPTPHVPLVQDNTTREAGALCIKHLNTHLAKS